MDARGDTVLLSPADLTGFLACEHLSRLSLEVALGTRQLTREPNPNAEMLRAKGEAHEQAYLQNLIAQGKTVARIAVDWDDFDAAVTATHEAMRSGVDVVYQAAFAHDSWRGLADFLLRVETPSQLGAHSYEALDTKLARSSKPAYILQLCFYSQELARIHGVAPAAIHVLLGSGEQQTFRPEQFGAYFRRVRSRLEEFVADPPETTAVPVDFCDLCDFRPVCEDYWDEVDHLSRVAGLYRRSLEPLHAAGITTLAGLAAAEGPVEGLAEPVFEKLHSQARLQLRLRETGVHDYELLQPSAETGFALLPEPSPGDLFFDFEGNPFWDPDGGLEYLWGILDTAGEFTPLWARDHASERAALEQFVDLVHERLAADPTLHVYHYASYEVNALKRLAMQYGTREDELDDLLRRRVFVDLLAVVRGGLRTSEPGLGLKALEVFLPLERAAEIRDGLASIVEYERYMETGDETILDRIAAYNREDCVATELLRDWLLGLKAEAIDRFGPIPAPEPEEPRVVAPARVERAAVREALLEAGEPLAAALLDYHDREERPIWWAFYERLEQTPEELIEDAEAIGLLSPDGAPRPDKRSLVHVFTYPPQEQKLRTGDSPFDHATGHGAGEIVEHDPETRRLELKRGPSLAEVPLPRALLPGAPYDTHVQEDALMRLGRSLLADGGRYPAIESILRRTPFPAPVQTGERDEMKALVRSLDGRHLVIQGPPGSGKTWTSGRLIADLLAAGKTVGVASTSHKAIHNLLDAVEEAAGELGVEFEGRKKASAGNPESYYDGAVVENVEGARDTAGADLAAGTAWLFSREEHDATLDYLFVDEAGQVSLADVLAMGTCARNVILVGDPLQLAQVTQGVHPGGSGKSVLDHLLGGDATVPPDRGLFLERTFRLHPDVCGYISDEFYEGRLRPDPVTSTRTTPLGTGLRYLAVEHEGRRQSSPEEVEAVRAEVERLRRAGVEDVMVVAPFNAQVDLLRAALPASVRVGTVDKFQGQEAAVVLYSMASSSGEDVPHGLEFLLSRNRLNVAISRAQCLAYLVCSPRLLELNCRTIEHMRRANALCRFVELAEATRR